MKKKIFNYALLLAALLTSSTIMAETTYEGYDFTNLNNNTNTTGSTTSKGKVKDADMNLLQIGELTFDNRFAVSRAGVTKGWTAKNYPDGSEYGLYTQYKDRYFTILDLEAGDQIKVFWETKGDGALNFYDADAVAGISPQGAVVSGKAYTIKTSGNVNLYTTETTKENAKVYIQNVIIIKGATASAESVTYDFAPLATTSNGFTAATYWNANAIKIDGTNGYFILKGTGETAIAPRFAYGTKNNDWSLRNNSRAQYCGLYTQYGGKTLAIMDLEEGDKVTINVNEENRLQFSGTPIVKDKNADDYVVKNTKYTVTAGGNLFLKTASGDNNTHINSIIIEPETMTTPSISLKSGDATKVVITKGASDYDNTAKTYYTTDGTDPTSESAEYTGELSPESNCTIKAITISKTGKKSAIAEYQFVNPNSYTYTTDVYNFKGYGDGSTAVDPTWGSAVDGKDLNMLAIGDVTFGNKIAIGPQNRNAANNTGFLFRDSSPYYGLYSQYDGRTISVLGLNPGDKVTINIAKKNTDTDNLKIVGETENIVSGQAYVVGSAGSMDFTSTGSVYIESIKIETQNDGTGDVAAEELTGLSVEEATDAENAVSITAATSSRGYATVTYYTTDGSNPVLNTNANRVKLESNGNITYGEGCSVVNVATISTVTGNISSTSLNVTYTSPAPATPTITPSETENTFTISTVENTFYSTDYDGTTTLTVSEGVPTGNGTWTAVPTGGIITLTAADNGKTVYAVTINGSNISAAGSAQFTWRETVNKPTIIQTGNKVRITAGSIDPDYEGTKKVRYTFGTDDPTTEVDSGTSVDITEGATDIKAVTVGQVSTNTSEEESLTLLAQPTIAAYTEGDAKNTIQITNANFYSTDYDGTTALTISDGKPSGDGTWTAVTDANGLVNTLAANCNVYAVKVDGNNISPVSAVHEFTYDTSVLPNAAAPTITASDNKVTITTKEEGATTKYYIGNEAEGTTITGTSATIEDLNANTTIKAVSTKDGKQDATTNFTFTYISTLPTITQGASSNEVAITIGNATLGEGEIITTTYQIGDAAAVGITENKTLTDLTADDNNKVITVTTTVTKDNTVTNSASATLTFAYVAPVSDGKIDVTYDFTGFDNNTLTTAKTESKDKVNAQNMNLLQIGSETFDNRFAVSRAGGAASAAWVAKNYNDQKGLFTSYNDRYFTILDLKNGDKITITWSTDNAGTLKFFDAPAITGKSAGDAVESGTTYTISTEAESTNVNLVADGSGTNTALYIKQIVIHEAETLSAPTIAVNPENSNEVIITAGKTNNADATITTYFAITTDGTAPEPTIESTTQFAGSGAKETITLTQSIKIKAISVSSTTGIVQQASEVKEFTYVAETLTAPTIKLALADNSVVITAGKSNNEEATVTTYYSLNGETPTISEANEQKFTGESKELTLEADATIIAVSVSSTGKAANATSETFTFTYDAPDGKTRFNTTYDFTEKNGNPINQDANHKVTSNGTSLYLLAYDENTNFDNRFAIGPDSRTGNGGFYFRNNNATYKGLFTGYDSRNFSVLNLKKGDKVTLTLSNNAETLKFVDGDVVLSGKAYTAKADGNMDFVTTGSVYIEKVVIAEAEAVQAPTLTLSEDGTKVTIAAGASNNPEATVSTYYTTTGSISFNDGKAVTEGLTKLTADNSVVTVAGTTNIEAITISNCGAESIVTKGSYVEPVVESDSKTYSFIGYGDKTGVIPAYATETASGGQTLYLLATGDETFDNRFAVGPKREDANVFKFRVDGSYKGLYSQYDKRYFSILDLKKGEKVTLTINGNAETLQFADAAKVLEMTGGTNAAKVAEGAKVKSGTTYYINEDGNLDFVTTGSIYIESAKISVAVEDEELTIQETVSKPTVAQQGNSVTIVSGESTLGNSVTTYYTTDGTIPTVSSTKYTGAFALTADCTVKAITISELGTKSEVEELAFTYIEPKHQNGYGLYEFTGFAGTDAVTPDYDENGQLKIGAEDFDGRFACGPSNRIEDGSSFKFREAGDYKGLWSQYGDRTLTIKGLKASDSFVISGAQVSLKLTGTSIVANMESGDAIENGVQYFTSNDGDVELITTGSTYIESIEILNGDGTLPELVSKPTMRQLQGVYNTVRLVPGRSSRSGASVATYYTTDGSEPTAEAKKVITTRNIKVPEGTQSVKAITISSTGQQSSVVEVAVSYMTPVDNGEPYNFVGYGSTGGTKPDWGSEVTIGERKMQTVSIGTENFNERFAAGPKRDDGSMMMFRDNGDYKGLWTAYADRYFSVLNLKKGDKVVLILNEKAANLQLVDGDAVVSGQEYTVGAKGSLDFVTTEGGVYIESVVIINDGEDEAETEPEPSTDPDPETPSDQTTTNYGFAEYGDATGVVPDWGETITSGGEQLSMLAIDEENFDNRLACGPVRTDDKVFKFRNSGDYKGLYSQYADRYLSILNLKDGDMVTISMHPKAANLAFRGTPAVSNGMSNVQLRRGMRAARAASAGDMVESGATYVISTSDSSVNLDFVTTGSTYISSISIVSSSEATGIKVLKNLEDEGELRIFDLMGRRVTTPVKGKLYIVNGRKMIYK